MRIIINEMKKIWNVNIILIILLLCTLFYLLFMEFYITNFPNGHSATEEVEYSIELLQRYGPTLEEDEFSEFITETREKLISEIEMHIKSNPIFSDAGIYSYEDYERAYKKEILTETEKKAVWTLLGEECGFVRFKLQAIELIEEQYHNYPKYKLRDLLAQSVREKEIERFTAIEETEEYRNIMDKYVYYNTVEYALYLAILSVLAVLVLVSPLIVGDRARDIHLLQYSSKLGRKILNKQFISVILSVFYSLLF